MTKPRVPNTKAKAFGPPPKAGATKPTPSSQRPQKQQDPPLSPDGTRRVPADEAMTEPRVPFIRRHVDEPPTEAAKGDDDVMSQSQSVSSPLGSYS